MNHPIEQRLSKLKWLLRSAADLPRLPPYRVFPEAATWKTGCTDEDHVHMLELEM